MDKYEYKIRVNEIKNLISEKKYKEAVEIADTIDWKNVRNNVMLCTISDLYKMCKRFEDSRDVLMLAYQRNPGGRMILYSLCELSIKLGDVVNANEYFKEFVQVAPRDTGRFVLRYKLYTACEVGLDERIGVLEELQQYECKEKWMYELAYLYHMQGYGDKCVEECNQIVIYFGEGKYVVKALELKALHEPLSYEQDVIYRRLTGPKENDILVKDMDVSKYNTIDLQKELANSLAEVLFDDTQAKEALKTEKQASENTIVNIPVTEPEAELEPKAVSNTVEKAADSDEFTTKEIPSSTMKEEPKKQVSFETRIFNAKDVEAGLNKNAAVKEVIVPRPFDEMHEVMPKSSGNPAIIFPNYDDMVYMEGDGQISFNLPDEEIVDKQITGQISIADVQAEWERMKNANERKWRDDMRRKVLKQTDGLFKDFEATAKDGLLEKLESEVEESENIELTREEREKLLEESRTAGGLCIDIEEESDLEPVIETKPEEGIRISESESEPEIGIVLKEVTEEPISDIREIVIEDEDEPKEPEEFKEAKEAVITEEPAREELFFDRTPFMAEESASEIREIEIETKPEITSNEPEPYAEDNTGLMPDVTGLDYLMAFAEASEERDLVDKALMNVVKEESEVEEAETEEESEAKEACETKEEQEDIEEPEAKEDGKPLEEPKDIEEPEAKEDRETKEEPKDIEAPEAKEVSETESEPKDIEEPEAKEACETKEEPKDIEEPETKEESETKTESEIRPSGFTKEQEERFESYIQTESGREQIKGILEGISMRSAFGNIIISSEDKDGSIELAKAVIMELTSREPITGKVAKIKASTLNAKDAFETLLKMENGALIIQDANELRRETLDAIRRITLDPEKQLFIALTTTTRNKNRFINDNRDMLESFTVTMDVEALSNKELAKYAKAYAYSKAYAIDEMGMLALHTRIESKQTNEHCVTISEVKEMVGNAIVRATKKNAKHFFDVLVGKRYDENEMIVLKEKDFIE